MSKYCIHTFFAARVNEVTFLNMDQTCDISPTLADFLEVPYHTKITEAEAICGIWDYIVHNNLLIDMRTILLDAKLKPLLHPPFYWRHDDSITENSVILLYIAKMHLDPEFILLDRENRLDRIRRNIAARKILDRWRYYNGRKKAQEIEPGVCWLRYLVGHYGNGHTDDLRHAR